MDIEQAQLEKARIFAYWGYIGFMLPIAGIISSAISISILDRLVLDESDEDGQDEYARIKSTANVARVISIILLLVTIVAAIVAGAQIINAVNNNPMNQYYQYLLEN